MQAYGTLCLEREGTKSSVTPGVRIRFHFPGCLPVLSLHRRRNWCGYHAPLRLSRTVFSSKTLWQSEDSSDLTHEDDRGCSSRQNLLVIPNEPSEDRFVRRETRKPHTLKWNKLCAGHEDELSHQHTRQSPPNGRSCLIITLVPPSSSCLQPGQRCHTVRCLKRTKTPVSEEARCHTYWRHSQSLTPLQLAHFAQI
ncbi:hypothetical protein K439DRAFT_1135370 [Ramaria rubella]|nr:hypothetical protein K439DRAFT_1135370 [Ramaria rubella]